MKIVSDKAARSHNTENKSLEKAIDDILTAELCTEIINIAYSEDDEFSDDAFIEADTFWDVHSADDVQDICLKFFNGSDLDSRSAANPSRDYFRFDGYENVESTDYPGDIYLEELSDEIVDYIINHADDRTFPDKIQRLIDKFTEFSEDD